MTYYIESLFWHRCGPLAENLKCCVVLTSLGRRCGYVGVGKDNPLFGLDYQHELSPSAELLEYTKNRSVDKQGIITLLFSDLNRLTIETACNVHGSLTFSNGDGRFPILQIDPIWWFGFDCAHVGDQPDHVTAQRRIPNYFQITSLGTVRSKEYVIQECKNLAEQLANIAACLKGVKKMISTQPETSMVTQQISCKIPVPLWNQIKQLAIEQNTTATAVATKAFEDLLQNDSRRRIK